MKKITRRAYLRRSLVVLGAASLAPSMLQGCGSEDRENSSGNSGVAEPLVCEDASGASAALRENLQYHDNSTAAGQMCSNCQLFQPGARDTECGGCTLISGPINPNGHCTGWVQRQS